MENMWVGPVWCKKWIVGQHTSFLPPENTVWNKTHMEHSRIWRNKTILIADLHTSPSTSGAGSRISHEGQEDYI